MEPALTMEFVQESIPTCEFVPNFTPVHELTWKFPPAQNSTPEFCQESIQEFNPESTNFPELSQQLEMKFLKTLFILNQLIRLGV